MTRSVLVVDDSGGFAVGAVQALFDAGYDSRGATSVDAAFAELVRGVPDVVVLDHALDRTSLMLKSVLLHHRVRVLYVSGLDDDVARSVAATHDWPFLAKPFVDAELLAAVATLCPLETPPMPERPSLVPDLPPPPAAVAPREEPLPPPPAAPAVATTPSGRPLAPSKTAEVLDRVGDIIGCLLLFQLCRDGKIGGVETMFAIGAILGVNNGVRQYSAARVGGAGVGVAGALVLVGARWLAPAAGAAELARASGVFGLVAVLVLGAAGCPKLPPVSGCAPLAQRCDGDRPQVCSPTQRWHYVGDEPCGATPGQSCQVRAGVAGCARGPAAAALGADPCAIECSEECRGALLAKPDCAQEPRR